ncbi:FtsX-like permease family protein [Micromonospora pisi]|uniref:FtsX-like permease family protein n=1 Tax=Micromonospora pisi TaxID=589240 RepID=A0A495JRK4_9ACTN|nr:ABC transporter permease [Micromonospora pisi]RKR91630.1 FtsX-like permease family protein [Micromonospora pisi]
MSRNRPDRRPGAGRWRADLLLGARLVFAGGREGILRTTLAAIGVGLGVALLLVAVSIPTMLGERSSRGDVREEQAYGTGQLEAARNTLLIAQANTTFGEHSIWGRVLRPEGPDAPVPPGLDRLPAPGEIVVSPALADLLASPAGALLRPRFDYLVSGRIGDEGLSGPHEYAYYLGSDQLTEDQSTVTRIDRFGVPNVSSERLDPVLLLLVLIVLVVLLLPIAVFIGTAVRFGGEQRDRRLAALRLIGADRRMATRIAAGESLVSAVLGLAAGAVFFLVGRQFIGTVTLREISVFPSDVRPDPALAALILLGVPVTAVAVALLALRRVVIEPLGVVRRSAGARRRLWWRLILPVVGVVLLLPLLGQVDQTGRSVNQVQVTVGVVLLLAGVTAVLPWLVETVVRRLGGGTVAWQLATRRLQLDSAASARMVNGVAVAIAGGIALQMLFSGVAPDYQLRTGQDPARATMYGALPLDSTGGASTATIAERLRATSGVVSVTHLVRTGATLAEGPTGPDGERPSWPLLVGDCAALAELATLDHCADGDSFSVDETERFSAPLPQAGQRLEIGAPEDDTPKQSWTVPAGIRPASARTAPDGGRHPGLLATPGAVDVQSVPHRTMLVYLTLDPTVPAAGEQVRNTVADISPLVEVYPLARSMEDSTFHDIRRGLFIGVVAVMLLLGASLLVTTLEQLRERRRLLAVLVAFGARRSTMSWSILFQTAVPVLLGLALATVLGTTLGAVLQRVVREPVRMDWSSLAQLAGVGGGTVLLVTVLSLPALWRLMRPDGLRSE